MDIRIGSGFDVHRLVEGRDLIICGVKIPHEKGLLGHSDADVATHALMDAILGAVSEGDIGKHFPDTDARYKGISSMLLLEEVNKLIAEKGYKIGNIDITIMAERPKFAPHILKMRETLSEHLGMGVEDISVKATTTEGLSFTGREEGIAASAVVILSK